MPFPTTPIHGKLARISDGDTKIDYTSGWTINVARDVSNFVRQGQQYREGLSGQDGWAGSANMVFLHSTTAGSDAQRKFRDKIVSTVAKTAAGDLVSSLVRFVMDTTDLYLSGTFIITGMTVDAPVGDVIRGNFTFTGSGALNFSTQT